MDAEMRRSVLAGLVRLLVPALGSSACADAATAPSGPDASLDGHSADGSPDAPADSPHDGASDATRDARGTGRIGDPCTSDLDCGEGAHPTCFVDHVSGLSAAATPGGYCSSPCGQGVADCGLDGGLCMWFGFTPQPTCFRSCGTASDCRAGYSCFAWMAPVCFPTHPFLDCDPSAGDGGCTMSDGQPGGCYRLATGAGMAGRCGARCAIGAGHCRPDPSGAPLRCRPVNATLDADGGPTGDPWEGPVCDLLASSPLTAGACVYGWTKPAKNYATLCADGFDCASQFDPLGDDDCLPLCYLDGGAPSDGSPLPGCADGGCRDVYRLGSAQDPSSRVGLCPMGP
jgi:hypothetical protein